MARDSDTPRRLTDRLVLLPGAALAWACTAGVELLVGRYADSAPSPGTALLVAGVTGAAALLAVLVVLLVSLPLPVTLAAGGTPAPAGHARAIRARPSPVEPRPRPVGLRAIIRLAGSRPPAAQIAAAALLLALPAALTAGPLVSALLPAGLDFRDDFVLCARAALGLGAGTVLALLAGRWRGLPVGHLLWVAGTSALAARVVLDHPLRRVFLGREHWLLAATLLGLVLAFALVGRRVPPRQRATVALAPLVAVVAAAGLAPWLPRARADLEYAHPGPAQLLDLTRSLFDLDGDGHAAVLGGRDCDDTDATIHPSGIELVGNGVDENCDGEDQAAPPPPPPPMRLPHASGPRRSVVLLTVDALRADHLLRDAPDGTPLLPRLRALAARGAVFPNTYSHAPYTAWAVRSLMTGATPLAFTVGDEVVLQLPSVPQRLARHGWRSLTPGQYTLLGGPEVTGYDPDGHQVPTSADLSTQVLAGLDHLWALGGPFFLWMHYMDAHVDYLPHPEAPVGGDTLPDRYRQELWFADRELGRVLDALDAARFVEEGGILAIGADHGELLGERGRYSHAVWVDDAALRVPVIVVARDVPAGVFPTRVRLTDLPATLYALATGAELPGDGRDLRPVWTGEETADRDVDFVCFYEPKAWRGLIRGPWTYVEAVRSGAERLTRSAGGQAPEGRGDTEEDLADEAPEVLREMRAALRKRWSDALNDVVVRRRAGR